MKIDQSVAMQNLRMVGRNEAHPAHIGSQRIYLVNAAGSRLAILPTPQVELDKLIGVAGVKLGKLDVGAPDPVSLLLQIRHQMMADKTSGAGNKCFRL